MILDKGGRSRSLRTAAEVEEMFKKEMDSLTPEERKAVEVLLEELKAGEQEGLYNALHKTEYKVQPVSMEQFVKDPIYLGNTCDGIYPKLLEDLTELFSGGYHESVWTGCIDLDAIIQGADGSLRTIREWLGRSGEVVAFAESGAQHAQTGSAKHSGCLPVLRLELANGMEQRLTPKHEVMAWRGAYEWTCVRDLSEEDFVVVPRHIRTTPTSSLTEDEAGLLAYWCTDGSSSDQRSRFTDGNPETSLEVLTLLERLGFSGDRYPLSPNCWEVYVQEHKRSGFLAWLRENEGHYKTKEVLVPDSVCRASDKVVARFINRVWAAEGCCYCNPRKSPPRFTLGMTSERFIRQMQVLLLRFGVLSRIQFTPQFDKRTGHTTETWLLTVTGAGPLRKMLEAVGPILGKEEACSRIAKYCAQTKANTNVDIIPMERKWLSREMIRRGLVRPAKSRWWGLAQGTGKYLSRDLFEEWLKEFGSTDLGRELEARFPSEFSFERVISVEDAGELEVGDICDVDRLHSFVSNGIYSHNSIGYGKTFAASIGVCRVLYELSCLRDPHSTFGLARDSNLAVVCLSVNEMLAVKVAFENIATKVKASPYFQQNFAFEPTKKELRFPNNIWVAARATTDTSALGLNVIGVLLDECLPEDSRILLGDGSEASALELYTRGGVFEVSTFDFQTNTQVTAPAQIRRSTDQECFELTLADGTKQRAGATHPIAVQRDGHLVFIVMSDILDGDEVVTYGALDRGTEENARRADEGAVGERRVCGPEVWVDRKAEERGVGADEERHCLWEASGVSSDAGSLESELRSAYDHRSETGGESREQGEEVVEGGTTSHVAAAEREGCSYGGVQTGVSRAQSTSDGCISAQRGHEKEDLRVERLAPEEGRLPVSGTYFHDESGAGRIPIILGTASDRDPRSRFVSPWIHLRKAGSPLYLAGALALDVAGLSGSAAWWLGEHHRGEASGVHVQLERARQNERRSELLRGARLGVRGVGRALAVAPVVSKRSLGVRPTYDVSVPGYEVFVADGVLVHNTNFMPTKGKESARMGYVDHADVIYNSIQRRMKSRFQKKGKLPGMLFIVSSKKTTDDFTARRIRMSRGDPSVFVRDYALWDVKRENYSEETFAVIVGNDSTPSRILTPPEAAALKIKMPDNTTLLDVPEDFRVDFESDLEGSIRDLAGVATVAISPFIQRREKIMEAVEQDKKLYGANRHPFSVTSYDPSKGGSFIWEKMIQDVEERQMPGVSALVRRPHINPHAARHIHIDPALRNDALGLCMAHIAGYRDVIRRSEQGQYMERAPVYVVDLVLQVLPPPGEEIILGDIRRIIYELHAHGYMITHVSLDSFQSRDTLQQLQAKGYSADLVSVDTSMEPYETLKTALYENRIYFYEYPPLIKELQQLERDAVRRKVDHPPKGSKDVSDALAGVCYTLNTARVSAPLPMMRGISTFGDAWMPEQQQAQLAGNRSAGMNAALTDYGMLPPIMVGGGGRDGESF